MATNYNLLANKMLKRKGKKYPIEKHNFKSEKYNYVYNISIDGVEFWITKLEGLVWYHMSIWPSAWVYYSNSEEDCAKKCYQKIKQKINGVRRENKKQTSKRYRRHINWENWLSNYEKLHQPII